MQLGKEKKYQKLAPKAQRPLDAKDIRKSLREWDPEKIAEDYFAQSPSHYRNPNPKMVYHVTEFTETQSSRVIKKFGGVSKLQDALLDANYMIQRQAIYKWTWPQERGGTGGLIPTRVWPYIMAAARLHGIFLSPDDVDAREQHVKKFQTVATTIDGKLIPFIDSYKRKKLMEVEEKKRLRAERRKARTIAKQELKKAKRAVKVKKTTARKLNKQTLNNKQSNVLNGDLGDQIDIRHLKRE